MEWNEKYQKKSKIVLLAVLVLYCFFCFTGNIQAAEHSEQEKEVDQQLQETMDSYLEELDFSDWLSLPVISFSFIRKPLSTLI